MKVLKIQEYNKINEFNKQNDIEEPIKSFELKGELCPIVWNSDGKTLKEGIREKLLEIANNVYDSLELSVEYSDVILSGSLSNMNYSEYSDFDLHIVLDFSKIDENIALVKKYFDNFKANWNSQHDIKIKGFDVEIYLQDINEPHVASGIFSLLNNKWNIEPKPFEGEIDTELVKKKAEDIMLQIDILEEEMDTYSYEDFNQKAKYIWDKIKKCRAEGLKEELAEISVGNIVFKLLRRNGFIEKIVDLKLQAYDKHHSMK